MPNDENKEDYSDPIKGIGFKLRENEFVVKTLDTEEGYHAILHGEKIEWFKTAYQFKYFRTTLLTNHRLLFLKGSEIAYEVSLKNIEQTVYESMLGTNPRIRLNLKAGGGVLHIVFESISSRVFLGNAMESAGAERLSKEWIEAIDLQRKEAKARSEMYLPPPPPGYIPECSQCGQPLTYVHQYSRWYCYNCKRYS
jgi:hypothetical protein